MGGTVVLAARAVVELQCKPSFCASVVGALKTTHLQCQFLSLIPFLLLSIPVQELDVHARLNYLLLCKTLVPCSFGLKKRVLALECLSAHQKSNFSSFSLHFCCSSLENSKIGSTCTNKPTNQPTNATIQIRPPGGRASSPPLLLLEQGINFYAALCAPY